MDGTNGFFKYHEFFITGGLDEGSGNIYFHAARLEEIESPGNTRFNGVFSGIFDADLRTKKITKGRFDHGLSDINTQIGL